MFPFHVIYNAGPIDDPSLDALVRLVQDIKSGSILGDEVTVEPLEAWRRVSDGWFRPAPGAECDFSLMRFLPQARSPESPRV